MPEQIDIVELQRKLYPGRFPNMSSKMAAIVGYLLGQEYTSPALDSICVTSDGYCLAQQAGDIGFNHFLGDYADLAMNWQNLMECVGLSTDEETYCLNLLQTRIQHYSGVA